MDAPTKSTTPTTSTPDPSAAVVAAGTRIRQEVSRVIVGQEETINLLLISLLARGHSLLEGVPGLAKTLLVQTFAQATSCSFSRIQFTPDLLPSDIIGTELLEEDPSTGRRSPRFVSGPIFAHVVLADEINRTPPKTQAALLQAMQEGRVAMGGSDHPLPEPFFVFATQNPIEHEGTYPLPEAQLDRFMLYINIDYPSSSEEREIIESTTVGERGVPEAVVSPEELMDLQRIVRAVPVGTETVRFAVDLARASRPGPEAADFVQRWVSWGAGPRAGQSLVLGAKARALLHGRTAVTRGDIRALALPVLRHRVLPNYRAEAEGIDSVEIIQRILAQLDRPEAL